MSDIDKTRKLHRILDGLLDRNVLDSSDIAQLRAALPELPKQKTLEELAAEVEKASGYVSGNYWSPEISLEDWLVRLARDLSGLANESLEEGLVNAGARSCPALPAGMRLADHEKYGRVTTSPKPDQDGVYVLLIPRPETETGADWGYAHECELTFIDAEPSPSHPEFLETEADYENAPEGTVVAGDAQSLVLKPTHNWYINSDKFSNREMAGTLRHVLRWGWGK